MEPTKNEKRPKRYFQYQKGDKKENALELCDHLIRDYGLRADRGKKRFIVFRYMSILLSTVVTILSYINLSNDITNLKWLIPIISTLGTFFTTLLVVTNAKKTWVNSRNSAQKLQVERFLFVQSTGKYEQNSEEENIKIFSNAIKELWDEIHSDWAKNKWN